MRSLAIEGLDGSGKTTVTKVLKEAYEEEGLSVGLVAPYRLASKVNGGDLYPLWKNEIGSMSAVRVLKHVLETTTAEAEKAGLDVLIFDRHWMTAFTEIADKEAVVEEWGDNFVPTAFLQISPETARRRADNDQYEVWMSQDGLNSYSDRYSELCRSHGEHLLGIYRNDDDVSVESIARSIMWDMNIAR